MIPKGPCTKGLVLSLWCLRRCTIFRSWGLEKGDMSLKGIKGLRPSSFLWFLLANKQETSSTMSHYTLLQSPEAKMAKQPQIETWETMNPNKPLLLITWLCQVFSLTNLHHYAFIKTPWSTRVRKLWVSGCSILAQF